MKLKTISNSNLSSNDAQTEQCFAVVIKCHQLHSIRIAKRKCTISSNLTRSLIILTMYTNEVMYNVL